MATRRTGNYRTTGGLEQAVADLVTAGIRGHAGAARQIAGLLMREVPEGVRDPEAFRGLLSNALTAEAQTRQRGVRGARGEVQDASDVLRPTALPYEEGLVLSEAVEAELREIVTERERSAALVSAGLSPTRSVLLHGPPGVGKTMTAASLARRLGLPLLSLDIASVVSSLLGSTGRNLQRALARAAEHPSVLLLDEFDALAKRRDDGSDVGELKRIVNVLLVELDRWESDSLLVAATNHVSLLDPAIERRFDRVIFLDLPRTAERRRILSQLADCDPDEPRLGLAAEATAGESGSSLTRLYLTAARRAVLEGREDPLDVLLRMVGHSLPAGRERDRFWLHLAEEGGFTNRQIADLSGVTHPTVGAGLKRARRGHERSTT